MTLSTDELHMHGLYIQAQRIDIDDADLVTMDRYDQNVLCIITCCIEYIMSNCFQCMAFLSQLKKSITLTADDFLVLATYRSVCWNSQQCYKP